MTKAKAIAATKAGLCKFGGLVFFSLGFAGIFLPLLPTTIFWIMAVWLFSKTHPDMIIKIYNWPKVGRIVEDFYERGVINTHNKKIATFGIVVVGGISLVFTILPVLWIWLVFSIFVMVLCYIWTRPIQ